MANLDLTAGTECAYKWRTGSTGGEAVNIGTEQAVKGSAADSINDPAAPLLVHIARTSIREVDGRQFVRQIDCLGFEEEKLGLNIFLLETLSIIKYTL